MDINGKPLKVQRLQISKMLEISAKHATREDIV